MESRKRPKISQLKSFAVAFQGIWVLLYNERNFRTHSFISIAVLICGFFFQIEKTEWLIILTMIGFVLTAEALNTAIEYICDLVSPEYHPMVKKIKDVAAAAVLIAAIIAAVIGCIIFIPYIIGVFDKMDVFIL